jgi:hypothetical protein
MKGPHPGRSVLRLIPVLVALVPFLGQGCRSSGSRAADAGGLSPAQGGGGGFTGLAGTGPVPATGVDAGPLSGPASSVGGAGGPSTSDPRAVGGASAAPTGGTTAVPSACDGSSCVSCGQAGSRCCQGNQCAGNACCYDGFCVGETLTCVGKYGAAAGSGGQCKAGHCSDCGGEGQPCCGSTCEPGRVCEKKVCSACGQPGQPCCGSSQGGDPCAAGAVCLDGDTCYACGGPDQPCCSGERCSSGCCFRGKCLAEGADCTIGTPGTSYGRCEAGRCTCGNLGERCCPLFTLHMEDGCSSHELACAQTSPPTCVRCGVPGPLPSGTPCCPNHTCTGGCCISDTLSLDRICISPGTTCALADPSPGTCSVDATGGATCRLDTSSCGGVNQPCCKLGIGLFCAASGTFCLPVASTSDDAGTSTGTFLCLPCGGKDQPCCTGRCQFPYNVSIDPECYCRETT